LSHSEELTFYIPAYVVKGDTNCGFHKRGKEVGSDYLIVKDSEEYCQTSEETSAAIIKD
jgi:hypothetical protein